MSARAKNVCIFLVLLIFSIASISRLSFHGEDLSSSYFSCRVAAAHESNHLYAHDPVHFDQVNDPVWSRLAVGTGFVGTLHPYVQTPLWAYALRPACTSMSFIAFNKFFLVLTLICFSASIWIAALAWAPRLAHPGWITLLCTVLYTTTPFRSAMYLTQTHIIFILLAITALLSARKYPVLAGLLLALAAVVKITPAFLAIYWLLVRRNKAALSFAIWSAALVVLSLAVCGPVVMLAYLRSLAQTSNMLLLSSNNDSFAAWWMGHFYPRSELHSWTSHTLPHAVKYLSLALALGLTVVGGLMDRGRTGSWFGAVLAIMAATVFTPLAWSHYFVLLLLPAMMMLNESLRERSWALLTIIGLILVLNLDAGLLHGRLHLDRLPDRAQFYAGLLSMAGLLLLYQRHKDVHSAQAAYASEAKP